MEYKDLIPETPAEELFNYLRDKAGKFQENLLSFKAISRQDAEAAYFEYALDGHFRADRKTRAARCWCSGCGGIFPAEYISAKTCGGRGIPAGIRMMDAYVAGEQEYADGGSIICPCCGESAVLRGAGYMRQGHTEQEFVARAYKAQGRLVIVRYMVEESVWKENTQRRVEPLEAFVVDGKKVVKLRLWQRNIGGEYFRLDGWTENKRFADTLGAPWFYDKDLPDLEGTSLENSKLWEYMAQTYEKDRFYPVAYARLYLKHKNVENLITSGMGLLVGDGIREEEQRSGSYYYVRTSVPLPRLAWVDWQEKKPSRMLGVTREGLRQIREAGWKLNEFQAYRAAAHKMSLPDVVTALETLKHYQLEGMAKSQEWTGHRIMQAVRYLQKVNGNMTMLEDYWDMAERQGLDLENPVIRWPRDLRAAHNRVQEAQRYATTAEQREAFRRMTARCRGLNWTNGEICIRVAESPEELVQEGKTLHHCVGRYAKTHAGGSIILFIRHARRPERSWYTLNVDVVNKRILQNHGYYNEHAPGKPPLKIPEKVEQFVKDWQEQVLAHWKLPPAKPKKQARRDGKNTNAA